MQERPATGSDPDWRPAVWLRSLLVAPPAPWPVGRSVRAAVTVAGPLLAGALTDHLLVGMWIAMGALLLAAGERDDAYRTRFRQIAVTTPLAATAYLLGFLSSAPHALVVVVMAALAFGAGVLSGYSHLLSVGTMQALLIAALALGLPVTAPYWPAACWFLVGAALYALLLGCEVLSDRRRPQRQALVDLLTALADLARARAVDAADLTGVRSRAVAALDAFHSRALVQRGRAFGPTPDYDRAATVVRAADQLLARLLAEDCDPGGAAATATRLDECVVAVLRHRRPTPSRAASGTLVRWRCSRPRSGGPPQRRGRRRPPGGPARRRPGRCCC